MVDTLPSWAPDWSVPRSSNSDVSPTGPTTSFLLQPLRNQPRTLTFWSLRKSAAITSISPPGPSTREPIHLIAVDKLKGWLLEGRTFLCFPEKSPLSEVLHRRTGITGVFDYLKETTLWSTIRAYTLYGNLRRQDVSQSSQPSQAEYQLTGWPDPRPRQWNCRRLFSGDSFLDVMGSDFKVDGLIELVKMTFFITGSDLVLPWGLVPDSLHTKQPAILDLMDSGIFETQFVVDP